MAPLHATTAAARSLDIISTLFANYGLEQEGIQRNAKRAVLATGPDIAGRSAHNLLSRRGVTINHTQAVTLGVILAYVVVIALLWNLPYIRWSLWPFKVSTDQGLSRTF